MSIQNALCGIQDASLYPEWSSAPGGCPAVAGMDLDCDCFLSKFPVLLKKMH